jgi:GR25 family glycosyltransferase involved in LPS biosynthesis
MQLPTIYIINCQNEERKGRMEYRMKSVDLPYEFVQAIDLSHPSNKIIPGIPTACMMSHLKAIETFLNSKAEYAIICEDDVYIRRDFKSMINLILQDFQKLELDILLLGYLINFDLSQYFENIYTNSSRRYYRYSDDLWGTQMYLISRKYAQYVVDNFTLEWAMNHEKNNSKIPFSSDWTITKHGNRALIFPMLAVEEGIKSADTPETYKTYHQSCKIFNYHPTFFI